MNATTNDDGTPLPAAPQPVDAPRPDFATAYEQTFPFVWRVARRLGVPPHALEDVCQDVFVIVHKRLHEFEGRSSLRTWVYGILHNVVLMHHRGARRRDGRLTDDDPEEMIDAAPDPQAAAQGAEAARIARRILAELSEDKRTLLVLVDLEGMSVPEAAEATNTNLNTAYARLRTARAELAAAVTRFQARGRRA